MAKLCRRSEELNYSLILILRCCVAPLALPFFLSAMSLLLCGCGSSIDRPKLAPVEGVVTFQGKPVDNAIVCFRAPGASRFATGKTDAQGHYVLTMYEPGDGTVVGENQVSVVKRRQEAADATPVDPFGDEYFKKKAQSERNAPQDELPSRYANYDSSDLQFEVKEGGNQIAIPLD